MSLLVRWAGVTGVAPIMRGHTIRCPPVLDKGKIARIARENDGLARPSTPREARRARGPHRGAMLAKRISVFGLNHSITRMLRMPTIDSTPNVIAGEDVVGAKYRCWRPFMGLLHFD
jgi:hypothetical protein